MKIYTKIVINMDTMETEDTEGFEYQGEVALCGGSDAGVNYEQSPEQRQMYGYLAPMVEMMSQRAGGSQPLWETGAPPDPRDEIPSMQGVMSDVTPYGIPQAAQPNQQWWQGVSPDVKAGLWQPYKEAGRTDGWSGSMGFSKGGAFWCSRRCYG